MRVFSLAAASALGASVLCASLTAPAGAATTGDTHGGGAVTGRAHLDGAQEVPGPGDPDGRGWFRFKADGDKLCYSLRVRRVETPTAAHIHFGPKGEAGPIAVALKTPPEDGKVRGCIRAQEHQNPANANRVLTFWELQGIKKDTFVFYVNVHNAEFPAGAVRGQLKRTH
ncbi:CHRD domain-containing protein [Streptomyces sp. S07_1.15]|uniref:CHRD domain-containing protein n=1 Tax=Streptomyces sp. S07_1.15 TaxID=2873925 RepID=UPI001D13FB14|nr:CHRD domain-containing protein [Streptomyces sp. S07_1.15]MCC3650614.1 CHRD domain-containing protein [Streptomyces sp. S07_1.15]